MHINSVVDPTVLGGMRIQVGDEVTDNTVVAQLPAAAPHGKGESLTIRFRAAPHAATEPDMKFSNNKE